MITLDKINLFVGSQYELLREVLNGEWKEVSCFNDYKVAFVNESQNKSIIGKVYLSEDGFEIIDSIWIIDGIYTDFQQF